MTQYIRTLLTVDEVRLIIEAAEYFNDEEFQSSDGELEALLRKMGRLLQEAGVDRYDD